MHTNALFESSRQDRRAIKEPIRLARVSWLEWPVIRWLGSIHASAPAENSEPQTPAAFIRRQLRQTAPGWFAVQCERGNENQFTILPLTKECIVDAKKCFKHSAAHHRRSARNSADSRLKSDTIDALFTAMTAPALSLQPLPGVWTLSPDTLVPPLDIAALLPANAPGVPEFLESLFTYVTDQGTDHLREFADALMLLHHACERMRQEHDRRRGMFLNYIRRAGENQPAFFPVTIPSRSKKASLRWRWNHEFLEEIIRLWSMDEPVYKRLYTGQSLQRSLEIFFWRFLGCKKAWNPERMHSEVPCLTNLAIVDSSDVPTHLDTLWQSATALTLASGAHDAPKVLAEWQDLCRTAAPGCLGARYAARITAEWHAKAKGNPANARMLIRIVREHGPYLVRVLRAANWIQPQWFQKLAQCGATPERLNLEIFAEADLRGFGRIQRVFEKLLGTPFYGMLEKWILERLNGSTSLENVIHMLLPLDRYLVAFIHKSELARRIVFLDNHLSLWERCWKESQLAFPVPDEDQEAKLVNMFVHRLQVLEVAWQWHQQGFGATEGVVEAMLAHSAEIEKRGDARSVNPYCNCYQMSPNTVAAIVLVGAGDIASTIAFRRILANESGDILIPLRFISARQDVLKFLSDLLATETRHIVSVLSRLSRVLAIQPRARVKEAFDQWAEIAMREDHVSTYSALQQLRGRPTLPRTLQRILDRPARLDAERAYLEKAASEGALTESAEKRLRILRLRQEDTGALECWVQKDLKRELKHRMTASRVASLHAVLFGLLESHWKSTFPSASSEGPQWKNAMRFYYDTDTKKSRMRALFRSRAEEDTSWRLRHGANAAFARELAKSHIYIEDWIAPYTEEVLVHEERWTVSLEEDPLEILRMGNYFDTCLSAWDFNAFAAVTNAMEINKRVLYVKDARDVVIGRKLIALTAKGELVGFRSYGACCLESLDAVEQRRVWIKTILDMACLRLVRRLGGTFAPLPFEWDYQKALSLGAAWYCDSPERFDWWVIRDDLQESVLAGDPAPLLAVLRERFRSGVLSPKEPSDWLSCLRALSWAGPAATDLIAELEIARPIDRQFLQNHGGRLKLGTPEDRREKRNQ